MDETPQHIRYKTPINTSPNLFTSRGLGCISAGLLLWLESSGNDIYDHEITCNADRRQPVGSPGCSCELGRLLKQDKKDE